VRAVAAGRFAARGARPIWPEVTFWSRLAIDHEVPRGEVGGDGTPVHAYASDEGALMSHDLARDIQLRPTRFRSGYAADEVEPFLAVVQDALRSPRPRLRAGDVAERRFTPVILKPGYRMDDVDDYLTEVEHLLSERGPGGERPLSSPHTIRARIRLHHQRRRREALLVWLAHQLPDRKIPAAAAAAGEDDRPEPLLIPWGSSRSAT
jgi:DivIVA domain-containing protein